MISFVIPVYKKPLKQFKRCIESLYAMSFKDIEIIAVFDGKDRVLESYADKMAREKPGFRKLVIEHGGACKARNAGFRISKGEIVAFWDADCYAMPEMARVWDNYFKKSPGVSFLYSGYKWTDATIPGYESEPFNPWLLKKYNYICTMSPIRREKVVEWDESLSGLQDWDYFRRIVDAGGVGQYIPCGPNAVSAGFETEFPGKESVSGAGREAFIERHKAIKKKFGDPECDTLVYGKLMKSESVTVANLLNADYFENPVWITKEYKSCLCIGFNPQDAEMAVHFMKASGPNSNKIVYWPGMDVMAVNMGPFIEVKDLAEKLKESIKFHICEDSRAKRGLAIMGIEAVQKSLPKSPGEVLGGIPEKFRILAFSDPEMEPHLDSIIRSLPDLDIDKVQYGNDYKYSKYTLGIHLSSDGRLNTSSKNMLLHGRQMISNAQEPFSGFVDTQDEGEFKAEVVRRVREIQDNPCFNKKAQEHYLNELSPEGFKKFIDSFVGANKGGKCSKHHLLLRPITRLISWLRR